MKYKVIKPFTERQWVIGDVVQADTFSGKRLIEDGYVEPYGGEEEPKHTVINVNPVSLSAVSKN